VRHEYWELVRNCDYSQRDHNLIQRHYQTLGYDMTISGQDGSRWISCSENDLARVTTTACHARYICETGEHRPWALSKMQVRPVGSLSQ
jgi:hypothetical protein